MTNELATTEPTALAIDDNQIAELVAREMREDEHAHAYKFVPTRIAMPSGKPPYQFSDGETMFTDFKAVIAVGQMARAYFPSKDLMGRPPICSSNDGIVGHMTDNITPEMKAAAMEQTPRHPGLRQGEGKVWACRDCPLSQWGSSANGGQACKDLRRLLLLIEGWDLPVILTLPPTSIKGFDKFSSTRRNKGEAYFTCLVDFRFSEGSSKSGAKYPIVTLSKVGELDAMKRLEVLKLRDAFKELVRTVEISADDYTFTDDPNNEENETPF